MSDKNIHSAVFNWQDTLTETDTETDKETDTETDMDMDIDMDKDTNMELEYFRWISIRRYM